MQRRNSALKNVISKRASTLIPSPVNLNTLVRVFLLDGSSKVLQMNDNSTARDVLLALKFNLDLDDISTLALFRIFGNTTNSGSVSTRRVDLSEKIIDVLRDPTDSGQDVRLLLRSWIYFKYGHYDNEVFQPLVRNKQPNTALWMAYMEATFMCMTGKLYLTEDESILLGCLKMQAESGDFNPAIHDLNAMKIRVASRFPNPICSKMKITRSDEIAQRVQAIYARISGKSKVEAQIEYLLCLRTWCPFYGATFFDVQCQYDDNPLDEDSTPPVIPMQACVGPLAIFLISPSDPPVIMRHPYKRILKWITHPDKHIFTYWVIKPNVSISDMEEYQEQHEGKFDSRQFCDCVYLVTSQVRELEFLVKSFCEALTGIAPILPGASGDLLPPREKDSSKGGESEMEAEPVPEENKEDKNKPKVSRLSLFFSALGGGGGGQAPASSGTGMRDTDDDNNFGDDTAAVSSSLFRNIYGPSSSSSAKTKKGRRSSGVIVEDDLEGEDANLNKIPTMVKYAASMSELQRVADEGDFSDDEDDEDEDEEDDGSGEGDGDDGDNYKRGKGKKAGNGSDDDDDDSDEDYRKRSNGKSANALQRASKVLFG